MVRETIQHFYNEDRESLEQLLADFDRVNGNDVAAAREIFAEYRNALERHIRWEEQCLYTVYEGIAGPKSGLEFLRADHAEIRELAARLEQELEFGNANVSAMERLLKSALAPHHLKEELTLCPVLDEMLTSAERVELLAWIDVVAAEHDQALPAWEVGPGVITKREEVALRRPGFPAVQAVSAEVTRSK